MGQPFRLRNDSLLISTEAPGGIYNAAQLKKIMTLCEAHGALVKATEDQRLTLFVPEAKAQEVATELKAVGLGIRHYQDGLHQPVSCIGELCPDHQQDALGTAMDVTQELSALTVGSPLKIGINGCGRCCVPCHTFDISVIGETNGYRISLGGKTTQIPEMATYMAEAIPAAELPKLIKNVVEIYKASAAEGESLQELMERVGPRDFIVALAPYSQDAAGSEANDGLSEAPAATGDLGESSEEPMSFEEETPDEAPLALSDETLDDALAEADPLPVETDSEEVTLEEARDELEDLTPAESMLAQEGGSLDIDPGIEDSGALDSDISVSGQDAGQESGLEDVELPASDSLVAPAPDKAKEPVAEERLALEPEESDAEVIESADVADLPLNTEPEAELLEEEELLNEEPLEITDDSEVALTAAETEVAIQNVESAATAPKSPDALSNSALKGEASDDLNAEAGGEDEESAFEEKLNESIEETLAIPVEEDVNATERAAAVQLLEESPVAVAAEPTAAEPARSEAVLADPEDLEEELILGSSAPVSMQTEAAESPSAAAEEEEGTDVDFTPEINDAGMKFSGITTQPNGRWALQFVSGARIAFDISKLTDEPRRFTVSGQSIQIKRVGTGIHVEVDGVDVYIPRRAA